MTSLDAETDKERAVPGSSGTAREAAPHAAATPRGTGQRLAAAVPGLSDADGLGGRASSSAHLIIRSNRRPVIAVPLRRVSNALADFDGIFLKPAVDLAPVARARLARLRAGPGFPWVACFLPMVTGASSPCGAAILQGMTVS